MGKELRKIKVKTFKSFLEALREFNAEEAERIKTYNLKHGEK
jgi:hypothetical protein